MASISPSVTRASSTDSSSALSNIEVARGNSVASGRADASTPPTSVADSNSMTFSKPNEDSEVVGRRSTRVRAQKISYNVNQLFNVSRAEGASKEDDDVASSPRGRKKAKIDVASETTPVRLKAEASLETDWDVPDDCSHSTLPKRGQAVSVKNRVQSAARKVASKLGSVLGKRKFEKHTEPASTRQSKLLKELDMGKKGVLEELDLDAEFVQPTAVRPSKRAKVTHTVKQTQESTAASFGALQKTSDGKVRKKWQPQGLYVGQEPESNASNQASSKSNPSKPSNSTNLPDVPDAYLTLTKPPFMPLPMFKYLEKSRDFIMPFDVFAPSFRKGDEKPKDWHKVNRNRIIGEARELWEKVDKLPASACVCRRPKEGELGCDYDCLNRVMQYECNDENCILDEATCSNRAFAELAVRTKKAGAFDIGVEVIKTPNRGFGVCASRTFAPGQIIMEYTGEIISETECQRRMRENYKDQKCYYLMELERNLVIDGTKGSMARFINHSCEPNCEVRMVKVNGIPRMGVFAGESGISTGEELTYDYNFDNFGETRQACYCGAPSCRGYLSKRLNAAEQKKQAKEELERKAKAAAEAQRHHEEESKRKKIKADRGSSWRGWVSVDDVGVKEQLKEEKRQKEEAEKNSSRAQRLAARRTSTGAADKAPPARETRTTSSRRKTTALDDIRPVPSTETPTSTSTVLGKRTRTVQKLKASTPTPSPKTQAPIKPSQRKSLRAFKVPEYEPAVAMEAAENVNVANPRAQEKASSLISSPCDSESQSGSTEKTDTASEKPSSLLATASRMAGTTIRAGVKTLGSTAGLRQSTLNFMKTN